MENYEGLNNWLQKRRCSIDIEQTCLKNKFLEDVTNVNISLIKAEITSVYLDLHNNW